MSEPIDGYWLRMGYMLADTLRDADTLNPTVPQSTDQMTALAEYFGGLMEQAHDMGMRLGESKGRYLVAMRAAQRTTSLRTHPDDTDRARNEPD